MLILSTTRVPFYFLRLRKRIRFGMPGTPLSKLRTLDQEAESNGDTEEDDDTRPLIETDENHPTEDE